MNTKGDNKYYYCDIGLFFLKRGQKNRYYQKYADKLYQELGRKVYDRCLVCGKTLSCLHHYFPKSVSSALRYDMNNGIPICIGCHFSHHNGDPRIHNKINAKMGKKWLLNLEIDKNKIIKISKGYYIEHITLFNNLLNN